MDEDFNTLSSTDGRMETTEKRKAGDDMKKPGRIWRVLLFTLALSGGLALAGTAAGVGGASRTSLTAREDWTVGEGWLTKRSPAGLWLEYTHSGSSVEGAQYRPVLKGGFDVSYYVTFQHAATVVDVNTITLRVKGSDKRFFIRVKGCNRGVLIEGQLYDGAWKNLFSTDDWIQGVGTTVCVKLSRGQDSDTLRFAVYGDGVELFAREVTDPAATGANFFDAEEGLELALGCEEGNLALTNLYLPSDETDATEPTGSTAPPTSTEPTGETAPSLATGATTTAGSVGAVPTETTTAAAENSPGTGDARLPLGILIAAGVSGAAAWTALRHKRRGGR